jgi:hypothetical protein
LARCSVTERTDELLLRCLAEPNVPIIQVFDKLAKSAAQSIRGLPLPVRPSERRVLRRTSFVGTGFLGIRNPVRFLRQPSADELHPFMVVISNAQGRKEEWRPIADQDFSISLVLLAEDEPFGLHAAGQPFIGPERSALERDIRRCLGRISRPESVARLLARADQRQTTFGGHAMTPQGSGFSALPSQRRSFATARTTPAQVWRSRAYASGLPLPSLSRKPGSDPADGQRLRVRSRYACRGARSGHPRWRGQWQAVQAGPGLFVGKVAFGVLAFFPGAVPVGGAPQEADGDDQRREPGGGRPDVAPVPLRRASMTRGALWPSRSCRWRWRSARGSPCLFPQRARIPRWMRPCPASGPRREGWQAAWLCSRRQSAS